jgi:hypothetical protein
MFPMGAHDSAALRPLRAAGRSPNPVGALKKDFGTDPELVKKLLQC